jgi:iron complex outermembrane receptor protein
MESPSYGADERGRASGRIWTKGSLFATSAIAAVMTMASAAMADPQAEATAVSSAAGGGEHPAAAAGQLSFHISPQPLNAALVAFGNQSGLQVTFDPSVPDGLSSKGVTGMLTPARALRQLLAGTDVTYRFTDAHTIMALRKSALDVRRLESAFADTSLETIEVSTSQSPLGPVNRYVASNSTSGTKSNTPIIETPQTVSVVTRSQMDTQQVQSVRDVAKYTPGVYFSADADFRSEPVYSRGFLLDQYQDGLHLLQGSWAVPRVDPYLVERAELLKGPASILYGGASPGGVLNWVSKHPTEQTFHEVQLSGGTFDRMQAAFDFGGPVNKDGTLLYRLTGVAHTANAQVDFMGDQRVAIAPAITWKPDADTKVTFLANYLNDPKAGFWNLLPLQGTVLPGPYGQIPRSFYLGDLGFEHFQYEQGSVGYEFEHRFDDHFTVSQNFRYMHADENYQEVQGYSWVPKTAQLARYGFTSDEDLDAIDVDTHLQAKFDTGPFEHTSLVGLDYQHKDWTNFSRFGTCTAAAGKTTCSTLPSSVSPWTLSYLNPNNFQAITTAPSFQDQVQAQNQLGLYVQDQVKFGKWTLLVGGRQDWVDNDLHNNPTQITAKPVTDTTSHDKPFTYRAGLVYLFDNGLAPYASYSTSFQPTSGTDFNSNPFKPTTGEQYEVGIKYQPSWFNGFTTVSVFDLTQQNVLTSDANHAGFSIQTGEVRSRGVEVSGVASLTEGLDVRAAYTYLDSRVTKDTVSANIGNIQNNTPMNSASVTADYTFQNGHLDGFGFGGGVRYVGETFGTNNHLFTYVDATTGVATTVSSTIPAYTLFDAAVHYDLGKLRPELKGFKVAVNASNLTDKTYVSACSAVGCRYGLGRTILASLTYRW